MTFSGRREPPFVVWVHEVLFNSDNTPDPAQHTWHWSRPRRPTTHRQKLEEWPKIGDKKAENLTSM